MIVPGSAHKAAMSRYQRETSKIKVVPNGVPLPKGFGDFRVRRLLGLETEFVILYLGRLVAYKGAGVLVRAYRLARQRGSKSRLVICGEGPLKDALEDYSMRNGLGVVFTGYVPDYMKLDYYQIGDLFILPSIRTPAYCEAWGLTINEAMMAGLPVLATDAVGASFDMIRSGETGWLAKENDPQSLCDLILKSEEDKERLPLMGKNRPFTLRS
jgi:glycosyltransferase involved in cell wall biosynthesis